MIGLRAMKKYQGLRSGTQKVRDKPLLKGYIGDDNSVTRMEKTFLGLG